MSEPHVLPCPVSKGTVCASPHEPDLCTGAMAMPGSCATFLAEEITSVLANPGLPADSVWTLNRVDAAFGCLDALLRAGARPPAVWTGASRVDPLMREEVTELYDVVSEALRETGDVTVCRQALCGAGAGWRRLHGALCAGAPLPEPWRWP